MEKRAIMVSPKGVAKYPRLLEPDTKFNKDGEYRVRLLFAADDATTKEFCATLDELSKAAYEEQQTTLKPAKAKTLELYVPYKSEIDPDTGEETGNIEVNFKTGAQYKDKDGNIIEKTIPLFDAAGKKIERKINIGSGSVLRVSFTPVSFYAANGNSAGVSLRLNAVQVIQLKEWKGATAEGYGFGKEDGYLEEEAAKAEDTSFDPEGGDF
mgnify:FL=1